MAVDYRAVLVKYIAHIIDNESVDFLSRRPNAIDDVDVGFTDEEWEDLQILSDEAGDLYDRARAKWKERLQGS